MTGDTSRTIKELAALCGAVLFVFAIFFLFSYGAYLVVPNRLPADDLFYHTAHAISYVQGWVMHYPVYTTYATHPADPWYGFHLLMALFIGGTGAMAPLTALWRVKLMNAVLMGLYFSVFFLIVYGYLRRISGASRRASLWSAFAGALLISAFSLNFMFRMLVIRPHLISSLAMLLSFYFTVRKKYLALGVTAFLIPFFYSISPFVLVPPFVYGFCALCVNGFRFRREDWYPFLFALPALLLGILARPDSLNYVYNAYYVNFLTVFGAVLGVTHEGGELYPPVLGFVSLGWVVPVVLAFWAFLGRYIKTNSVRETAPVPLFTVLLITSGLYGLYLLVNRSVEYFFPFWSLLTVVTVYEIGTKGVVEWMPAMTNGIGRRLHSAVISAEDVLRDNRKGLLVVIPLSLLLLTGACWIGLLKVLASQEPVTKYQSGAEFIARDSGGKGIVFTQTFSNFPMLEFFNHRNSYAMGMSNMITYRYDSRFYWYYWHTVTGEPACAESSCLPGEKPRSAYEVVHDIFKASYVFIDNNHVVGGGKTIETRALVTDMDADARFSLVYKDPVHAGIMVYKVN